MSRLYAQTHTHKCAHIRVCVCCIYAQTHTHTHTYIYIYIYTNIYLKNSFTYGEIKGKISDWHKINEVSIPAWNISHV